MWGLDPLLLKAYPYSCDIPPFMGWDTTGIMGRVGSDKNTSLPLLPISIWPFLCILSCRKSVLLVFRSFLEIVVLHLIVALVCLWEEVTSGSSYSSILVQNPRKRESSKILSYLSRTELPQDQSRQKLTEGSACGSSCAFN